MKLGTSCNVSGRLVLLEVIRKGKTVHRMEDVKNIMLNSGMGTGALDAVGSGNCYLMTSTVESYEDLDGTWSQSGNTVTRSTGSGVFPASPSQLGNEIKWGTGERSHVTARASDTSITVSGPARTITGGTIRRYNVNEASGSVGATTGFSQSSSAWSGTTGAFNKTTGVLVQSSTCSFTSAVSAYTLGSIIVPGARIVLPSPVSIDIDDQVKLTYERTSSWSGRTQTYDLGAESVGIPTKYAITSITGNGTAVDVTFSGATHFLAGDKLDLRGVVPKRFAISSASSNSTTFTINTALAHGLTTGDSVTIENASLAGYNGVFTVTTGSGTVLTITNAANPGAMGASGTVRLTTPGTYFDDLGLATIASMVSSSVARITSAITGPAVDLVATIGGDPGVTVVFFHPASGTPSSPLSPWPAWSSGGSNNTTSGPSYIYIAANAQAIVSETNNTVIPTGTSSKNWSSTSSTPSNYSSDWTATNTYTLNAGNAVARLKQTMNGYSTQSSCFVCQVTFNTPIDFTAAQRLRQTLSVQVLRDLP